MKLHIVVPTIMTNPNQEFNCLKELADSFNQAKLDYTIYFVSNTELPEFNNYIPYNNNIKKSISNLNFNISRAINSVYECIKFEDDDILGFIQSDTFFSNKNWILDYIDVLQDKNLNAGIIGARPHSGSNVIHDYISYNGKFQLCKVLWADGVMLFRGKVFRDTNGFDEGFFGDCESQDFCYRVHHLGYNNYWCSDDNRYFGYVNRSTDFNSKARYNKDEFKKRVDESHEYWKKKWYDFEMKTIGRSSQS